MTTYGMVRASTVNPPPSFCSGPRAARYDWQAVWGEQIIHVPRKIIFAADPRAFRLCKAVDWMWLAVCGVCRAAVVLSQECQGFYFAGWRGVGYLTGLLAQKAM